MKNQNEVATTEKVVVPEGSTLQNAHSDYYTSRGYTERQTELGEKFMTRNREDAKAEAKRARDEGNLSALSGLSGGWYGVFQKPAEKKESTTSEKSQRPEVQLDYDDGTHSFSGSTKEARAFARLLIEAARNAEYDYDKAHPVLKKSESTD